MLDFLGTKRALIPQGGDLPVGFTGKWLAAIRYSFLTEGDPKDYGLTPDSFRQTGGDWYAVYYADLDVAAAAATSADQQFAPSQVWLFEALSLIHI